MRCPRCNGRGHRPCHSAALGSGPAGGHSPRTAPDPLPAGASPPPGRALASAVPGSGGLQGTVARGRGKRGSRFLFPPALSKAFSPLQWQGPSPLPQHCAGIRTGRGPKPPASARPAPGGRFAPAGSGAGLLLFPDLPVCGAPCHAGGETRVAFPGPARRRGERSAPAAMAKAIAFAMRRQGHPAVGGQSPWRASGPPPPEGPVPQGRSF